MRKFLTIIGGCTNLKTLTLVIWHCPDFRGWPEGGSPGLKFASKLGTHLVEAKQSNLRPRTMDKLFMKLEKALGTYCEEIRVQRYCKQIK
jgi:hypothetical protein